MLRYYVYQLIDPRDLSVFYVGEGQDQRVHAHLNEYDTLIANRQKLKHPKHNKINELIESGYKPICIVIGRYKTKAEALAVEATLINWVYGHSELTNLNRGHGHENIRIKGSHEGNFDLDPPIPGDGRAAEMKREYLRHAGTVSTIDYIRESMRTLGYLVFESDSREYDSRYFPTFANGEYGFICHVSGIDFIIKSRENNLFNICLANTPSTNANINKIKAFKPSLEIRDANNSLVNGLPRFRGMKYPRNIPIENFDEFMEWFKPIADHLSRQ
ncbi:GIY-YIG nuclease family protein [Pseudidiomarina insulisalsae]|uniref:GIY-YIG domain-containing protein n=1 Tax=Pseudidiomarina insulisalsae TaxID=575789 RepID=A0A432YMS2_9GAMM|nr:GIY-YIG nuclease family protein [Pseudidiomarina insulisalsae]RUO62208.1 hypothetical protein CWI71_04990 [Pseudidiomarina insulisalsae]